MDPREPSPPVQQSPCPVPPEQRPLREYEQLRGSWFFSWAARGEGGLLRVLLVGWSLALPPALVVAGGSHLLRHDPPRLVVAAAVAALLLPFFLLLRQWLGWSYVQRRLLAERVEYEESGWYDGQVWEKPLPWRQQDLLVARHQVAPVLQRLRRDLLALLAILLAGGILWQAL